MKKQGREAEKEDEKQRREVKSVERRSTRAKCEESCEMLCFSMICGSAGSKIRLRKAAGAEVAVARRNEILHAAVTRIQVKMYKTQQVRTTF